MTHARRTQPQPPSETIIVFDTDCVLCSGVTRFVLEHERDDRSRFVSAWSPEGAALARQYGLDPVDLDRTYLVISEGLALTHSSAGIAVAERLKMPWRLLTLFRFVPRPLRDAVYTIVARNRYRWFGQRAACFAPPAGARHRFVDGSRIAAQDRAEAV